MLHYHEIAAGPDLMVARWVCTLPAGRGAPELTTGFEVVLPTGGAFIRWSPAGRHLADANTALFLHPDQEQEIIHPGAEGDRGLFVRLSPRLMEDLTGDAPAGRSSRPGFPAPTAALDGRDVVVHELAARFGSRSWSAIGLEAVLLELIRGLVARSPRAIPPGAAERIDHAREILARAWREPPSLVALARQVGCSPFHLSRRFRHRTGMTIGRYLQLLRLRAAARRVCEGSGTIAAAAFDAGFASHGHLTDLMRRRCGFLPSDLRGFRDVDRALGRLVSRGRPLKGTGGGPQAGDA